MAGWSMPYAARNDRKDELIDERAGDCRDPESKGSNGEPCDHRLGQQPERNGQAEEGGVGRTDEPLADLERDVQN